jgi:predicted RNA-binding Zn ribbon-like protein
MNQVDDLAPHDIAAQLDAPDVLPAGKLCLEFVNTLDWHASEQPLETIPSYTELIAWALRIGLISEADASLLNKQAAAQPALAQQINAWAIDLREAIYQLFVAIAEKSTPDPANLALLNEALPQAYASPQLIATSSGYSWSWHADKRGLDGLLWPILRSTARLLTEGTLSRIGQCADDRGCGYLFYDTSRNRSRRWCDMNSCGNRAKSQRHYARHRSNRPQIS